MLGHYYSAKTSFLLICHWLERSMCVHSSSNSRTSLGFLHQIKQMILVNGDIMLRKLLFQIELFSFFFSSFLPSMLTS